MVALNPVLIDVPMPIRTPRLLIRPKQVGDGATTAAAVAETWDELHKWMRWAENLEAFTAESLEIRNRQVMASFILRESIELVGIEAGTGKAVIWCGFHDIDWHGRQCDTGFWVRKSAQRHGFATEAGNALVRYAFGALGMRRIGLTHSGGNEASRRIAEKLGFSFEGIQQGANILPGRKECGPLLLRSIRRYRTARLGGALDGRSVTCFVSEQGPFDCAQGKVSLVPNWRSGTTNAPIRRNYRRAARVRGSCALRRVAETATESARLKAVPFPVVPAPLF